MGAKLRGRLKTPAIVAVNLGGAALPVEDPVLAHCVARVQRQLDLAVALLIARAWREHLDDELGRAVQLAIRAEEGRQARVADPDNVWNDVVIIGEDQAGRDVGHPRTALPAPGVMSVGYL